MHIKQLNLLRYFSKILFYLVTIYWGTYALYSALDAPFVGLIVPIQPQNMQNF